MNPVIKFATLFGLLAVEVALGIEEQSMRLALALAFFTISAYFVYRSFYGMRIKDSETAETSGKAKPATAS
jgi:K(+)-stimulated pyrophosphate-energized sodium pump